MSTLDSIKQPIANELSVYEGYMRHVFRSQTNLVDSMLDYIFNTRGKAVRPMLTILTASMVSQERPLSDRVYLSAMLVEMIHTASLVHDDVIDKSDLRRGKPSVNALWKPHKSVLIGDFILSKSFQIGMNSGHYDLVDYICGSMTALCEGELLQSDQSDRLEMTREIYYEIIHKKTATLFGISCGAGALAIDADHSLVKKMSSLGDCIGMAFQIKDDILDYMPSRQTGKPMCGDLNERKITLPLLSVLERFPEKRDYITDLLKRSGEHPENIETLYSIVMDNGGIEESEKTLCEFIDKARECLSEFSDSDYKTSFMALTDYIGKRSK